MGKNKVQIIGTETITTKDGKKIEVLKTRPVDDVRPCKECGKNPRKQASSRCEECVARWRNEQADREALRKKVEKASEERKKQV